ncbi:MAG TPA: DUF3108 domain-containing protein [Vicinamibacterales bacterium]|nr:DUF3108 domain-containing protein [Vicinamibacterales bacterium]
MRHLAVIALLALAPAAAAERPVPFNVGETLTFDVSWSTYLTAGTVIASVKEKRPSYNATAYYIVAEGRPTPLLSKLYSLYYKADTLIDASTLLPQRGSIYSEEGARHKFRTTQFDRRTNKIHFEHKSTTTVTADFATSPVVQDALSAIYVLRAIPLKAGEKMTMPVSDDGINYKATFSVAARETVKTGLGALPAWKIALALVDDKNQPVGRNLALWFSDDERRLPLKIQADLPVGSFNLALRAASR